MQLVEGVSNFSFIPGVSICTSIKVHLNPPYEKLHKDIPQTRFIIHHIHKNTTRFRNVKIHLNKVYLNTAHYQLFTDKIDLTFTFWPAKKQWTQPWILDNRQNRSYNKIIQQSIYKLTIFKDLSVTVLLFLKYSEISRLMWIKHKCLWK